MFSPLPFVVATTVSLILGLAGCTDRDPLVPEDVTSAIAMDGREWTYDVSWQNTRMLNLLISEGEYADVVELSVVLAARLHRLGTGRVGDLSDRRTQRHIQNVNEQLATLTLQEKIRALSAAGQLTQDSFDSGDFGQAKAATLEVYVLAAWLAENQ